MNTSRGSGPSPALVVAVVALIVALAGTAYAVTKIGTKQLKNKAVTTKKLKNKAVTTQKLGDGAVSTAKLGEGAVTTAKLDNGAVAAANLGEGAVTTAKLADGAATAAKIGVGAVGSSQLADGQVGAADLARPPLLIEHSQPSGTSDVPILQTGDLRLRGDCTGAPTFLIEAASSSGSGTLESSGIAEAEGGGESSFVNGPLAISPAFNGVTSISDADTGAGSADGNFKLIYDGPGVVVSVDMTITATNTTTTDSCALSGVAISAG